MATQTLRPNTTGLSSWSRTGGTTQHGVLSDDDDATYLQNTDTSEGIFGMATYAIAADERIKAMRIRARISASGVNLPTLQTRYAIPSAGGGGLSPFDTFNPSSTSPEDVSGAWRTDGLTGTASEQQQVVDDFNVRIKRPSNSTPTGRFYELYVDLDVWARTDAPTVTSDPSGTITDTDVPTIESYTAALNDGEPSQWSREVRVFRDEVYLAGGFDPETETDVEWEQTDTSLGSISTDSGSPDEVQVDEPLANSDTYRAYVRYGKNDVAGETLWSEWGQSAEFTLDLTLPTAPDVDVTVEQPNGRQVIEVTTAALEHDTVERLRVQRSDDDGETWATIRDGLLDDGLEASTVYTFHDYDAPRGQAVQYRARVTEGITASGTTLTSSWTTSSPVAHPNDGHTWLYDVDTWEHVGHYRVLRGVSRAPSEQAGVFHPLGRRTAVVVTAGRGPDQIAFDVLARDHQDDVDDVEALMTATRRLLVKWPEGNQDYIRVMSRPFDLLDAAGERRRDWSIQAVEVDSGITNDG